MLKQALKRGLIGIPCGIAIAQIIALAISAARNTGTFYLITPELLERMGSELAAAELQTLLCGILGFVWGVLSIIWDIERWSLLRQSLIFYSLGLGCTLLIEYFCGWIELDWLSVLRFLGIFTAVFAIVWIALYKFMRASIRRMNRSLHSRE